MAKNSLRFKIILLDYFIRFILAIQIGFKCSFLIRLIIHNGGCFNGR